MPRAFAHQPPPVVLIGALIAAFAVAACGHPSPPPTDVARHNDAALEAAFATAQAQFGGVAFLPTEYLLDAPDRWEQPAYPADEGDGAASPAPPPPAPVLPTRLDQPVHGGGADDVLFQYPSGELALHSPTCLQGSSCGCDVPIAYRYLQRDDGRVAVVRLRPVVKVYELRRDTCGYGCGQPPPPVPTTAAGLPAASAAQVEVIDAPYRFEQVKVTCANPIPAA